MAGKTRGTDHTNLRPLENAPFHSALRDDVGIKGRSTDDQVPGRLQPRGFTPMNMIAYVLLFGGVVGVIWAVYKSSDN